jgi:Ca2+-binding EF-hand superfamily protein
VQIDDRKSHVPAVYYKDPLQGLFDSFDANDDGFLSASEILDALRANDIDITLEQVTLFVDAADTNMDGLIDLVEFEQLLHDMAKADLRVHGLHFLW